MKFIVKGDDRTSPLTIYKGIIIAIISMFLIVPFFDYGQKISTLLTDGVIQASSLGDGANTEFGISKAIITSMVYSDETKSLLIIGVLLILILKKKIIISILLIFLCY